MKDQIILTGIHGFGYHGVFDHERKDGQDFFVDLTLSIDLTVPSNSERVLNQHLKVQQVSVTVHKPQAPVAAQLKDIAVVVTRVR